MDLSARQLFSWELRGDRLEPEKVREWFASARKVGEEKWLLDHAVPPGNLQPRVNENGRPEALLFRVISAKYPNRLPELYRAILKKPWSQFGDYIDEIVASRLTREQKLSLFEEGLKYPDHRWNALGGLSVLDQPLFRKELLKGLKEIPDSIRKNGQDALSAVGFVSHVKKSEDRQCWDALLSATKVSPYEDRIETIREIGPDFAPDQPDPLRRERLRFLIAFLDDRTAEPDKDDDRPPAQIRDFAAYQLAGLFRFPVERPSLGSYYSVSYNHDLGPLSRLLLRESVRELARRELANAVK
jgi:hypothetical protein